ncbi:hypothetical protein [Photobacterium iliopiscarium]|uniref:hypothetical protein n=1 Tax=Photobacterium iliopiscarium TaxID=56192 RepID=UPI0024314A82|nr:hypothetical protein [Photobacterium iliopiscarium]
MFTAFIYILFVIAVGMYASSKNRSVIGWMFLSIFISPLLGFLFLAICSKLPTKSEEEEKAKIQDAATQELNFLKEEFLSLYVKNPGFEEKPSLSNMYKEIVGNKVTTVHCSTLKTMIELMK